MYNLKETDQTYEVITQQLCDIIHCLLFHPIAINANNYTKLTVQTSIDTVNSDNDFDDDSDKNNVDGDIFKEENDDNDDNKQSHEELIGIGAKIIDSRLYTKLRENRLDHKFLAIDPRIGVNYCDLFEIDQKNDSNSRLKRSINYRDKKINGRNLAEKSFRTLPGLSDEKNEWIIFLSLKSVKQLEQYSKFNNMRDELLNNDICNISQEQWNDIWKRAELFKTTYKGKSMLSKKHDASRGIRKSDPIPTHHIMSLMIWSNFYILQLEFRKHCQSVQQENKKCQFSRWGFYLNSCIQCYGLNMEPDEKFYSCFKQKLLCNQMWLRYYYPTSLTKSYLIAQIYSNNISNKNGVIFVLNKRNNELNQAYIDCSWISDYGY